MIGILAFMHRLLFTDAAKISKYSLYSNIDNFYEEVGRMALSLIFCKSLSLVVLHIKAYTKIALPQLQAILP